MYCCCSTESLTDEMKDELEKQNGFIFNTSRRTANFFSCEALIKFLKRNDLSHVIRAHEVQRVGFKASLLQIIYYVKSYIMACSQSWAPAGFFLGVGKFIDVARIFLGMHFFPPKKLTTFFRHHTQNY